MGNRNAEWRAVALALRGAPAIYEEDRQFLAVDVIDVGIVGDEASTGGVTALKVVALSTNSLNAEFSPEAGLESVITAGVYSRVEGEAEGTQLYLTLQVARTLGSARVFPTRFTVSGRVESMRIDEGHLHAYMGWSLISDSSKVQSILDVATKGLPRAKLRLRVLEIARGRSPSRLRRFWQAWFGSAY
jgi:hypothetical protein